jgi:DNA-binding XRE family transcriptional regulator
MTTTNLLNSIDSRKLGDLLQQARKRIGMTQADAAKVIDAARTTIVAIEKGERRLKPSELIKPMDGPSATSYDRPLPLSHLRCSFALLVNGMGRKNNQSSQSSNALSSSVAITWSLSR